MEVLKLDLNNKLRELNHLIDCQLKRAGILNYKGEEVKLLEDFQECQWKEWITEVIAFRDQVQNEYETTLLLIPHHSKRSKEDFKQSNPEKEINKLKENQCNNKAKL